MVDTKLSQLSLKPADKGDFFLDRFYGYLVDGATDAERQVAVSPFDLFITSRRKSTWFWHDFIDGLYSGYQSGTGAQVNDAESPEPLDYPGVAQLQTGTSTTGYAGVRSLNFYGIKLNNTGGGNGAFKFITIFKTPSALSDGTNRYGILSGLTRDQGNYNPDELIGVRYRDDEASGNWQLSRFASAGSKTNTDSGIAVVANTWYRIEVEIAADLASVTYTINGVASSALTTTIPNNVPLFLATQITKALGTTNRSLWYDAYGFGYDIPTGR